MRRKITWRRFFMAKKRFWPRCSYSPYIFSTITSGRTSSRSTYLLTMVVTGILTGFSS